MRNSQIIAALVLLAVGVLLALGGCGTTSSGSGSATDTVTAIGTGTGSAAPDTAQLSLGVTFTAKDRTATQDGASKKAAAIVAAVKAAGLDAKDIQTGQISLSQLFDTTGRKVIGYSATQSIDVTTKLIDKVGAIVAAATGAGATNVSGPQFSLADANAARIDAIDKAMADAKARAAAMANAAGRKLGPVISVKEVDANQFAPLAAASGSAKGPGTVPPVQPGLVEATTQLTVVYRLE
jgi:uncharacterized protein YggE